MFISKLKNTYNTAEPKDWLSGDYDELDPVFAGRLAYLAKKKNKKLVITSGYRSTEEQTKLYNQYLQYKKTGKGTIKSAAKPGTSWHEFRLAVDTSTSPFRYMTDAQLRSFGLIKPIKSEPWHIQPIETFGETNRSKWQPEEQEEEVAETVYKTLNDVPSWGKSVIEQVIAKGGLTPTNGEINLTHSMLRMFIAFDKMGLL